MPASVTNPEIDREQHHLDHLYDRLERDRSRAAGELESTMRTGAGGTRQARLERDAAAARLHGLVARYDAASNGLCFGRLDLADGTRRYLGRIGLRADDPDADPDLIDWRAPAARAFYTATAAEPQGVRLRRHLHTRGRRVLRLDDELLTGTTVPADVELTGEAALLAALAADRTGRMQGAVATLQAEQDRIIRSAPGGALVVQGGPGTGKTVVALHRAAYLLYTHPTLDRRGVLVVGPNPVFLRYIEDVLPGLGETGVLLVSLAELYPGVAATLPEPEAVAEVKGRLVLADALAAAVRARQAGDLPPQLTIRAGGEDLTLDRAVIEHAAERARASGLPHNQARTLFGRALVAELARRLTGLAEELQAAFEAEVFAGQDAGALDRAVAADLASVLIEADDSEDAHETEQEQRARQERDWRAALADDDDVRALVQDLWPLLGPDEVVQGFLDDPDGELLTADERATIRRAPGGGWTVADVPLLDEAAELLGVDRSAERRRSDQERAEAVEYAQGVLDLATGSRAQEDEDLEHALRLNATDVVDATGLAGRADEADLRTVAERAAADRTWVFGHVIVDEAQELSPMAWRVLQRRCPAGSFTVVGDVAQGGAHGNQGWGQALAPFFGDRWRLERLTVNYRTPAEIMAGSDRVLAELHPELEPARAVRHGARPPVREEVAPGDLGARLAELAADAEKEEGRIAIVVPAEALGDTAAAVRQRVPAATWGDAPDLEGRVVVLNCRQVKGLEFDQVIVGDPAGILAESPRGLNDLYVALTRATRSLRVVHPGPVPAVLADWPVAGRDGEPEA